MSQETTEITIVIKNVPAGVFYAALDGMDRRDLKVRGRLVEMSNNITLDYKTMQLQNFYDCVGSALAQQSIDSGTKNAN